MFWDDRSDSIDKPDLIGGNETHKLVLTVAVEEHKYSHVKLRRSNRWRNIYTTTLKYYTELNCSSQEINIYSTFLQFYIELSFSSRWRKIYRTIHPHHTMKWVAVHHTLNWVVVVKEGIYLHNHPTTSHTLSWVAVVKEEIFTQPLYNITQWTWLQLSRKEYLQN